MQESRGLSQNESIEEQLSCTGDTDPVKLHCIHAWKGCTAKGLIIISCLATDSICYLSLSMG
ncbi:uncharacterized protein LOC143223339 isoform X2 [Tachypleus tridentatus]